MTGASFSVNDHPEWHWNVSRLLLPAATPICLGIHTGEGVEIEATGKGSVCQITTSSGRFFVTCEHVLSEFVKRQQRDRRRLIVAMVDGWPMILDPIEVKALDHEIDVAVFAAPHAHFGEGPPDPNWKSRHMKLKFPLVTPFEGEQVYSFGFPAVGRKGIKSDHVFIVSKVVGLTPRKAMLAPSAAYGISGDDTPTRITAQDQIGGASGGPAFVIRDNYPHLCGVISDGATPDQTSYLGLLKHLRPDGTLASWMEEPG